MGLRTGAGCTVSFNGTDIGLLADVTYSVSGKEVDVTRLQAARMEYDITQEDISVDVVSIGSGDAVVVGATGDVVFTPVDTSVAVTITNMVCVSRSVKGASGGRLETSLKFVPAFTTPA